jgi:hypothetical protein
MSDERPLPTPLPDGARCAIHPDQTAVRTCVRCGNYMCSACTSAGTSDFCLTCASRVGGSGGSFPFSRDHFTLDGLLNLSLSRWKANWQLLTFGFGGLMLAVYAISWGGEFAFDRVADAAGAESSLHSLFHPARLGWQIAVTFLSVAVQLALMGACLDLLEGRKFELEHAIERMRRLPAALLQMIVMYAAVAIDFGLHYLLFYALGGLDSAPRSFLIPGVLWVALMPLRVYVYLGVMFAMLALIADPQTNAFSAFAVSWRAVSGHRLRVIGVSIVLSVIAGAGVLACCVGLLASIPIASLMYVALFLALNQRERPVAALPHEGFQV